MLTDDTLDLAWILAVTRRWWWLIAGCVLVGIIGAWVATAWLPPVYSATATLLLEPRRDSGMSDYQAVITAEAMTLTYAQMLQETSVLEAAAEKAQLREPPSELSRRVKVEPIPDTQLIRIVVKASSATRAALLANAIAETFIQRIEASQAERMTDSQGSLESQMAELSAQMQDIQKRIDELGTPATSEAKTELAHLESILAGYRNTYATLLQSYEQMRLTEARSTQTVTIAEAARPPEEPVQSRLLYVAVAGLVGAIVGLGTAFLLENMDDTIKTPHGVKQALGLRVLSTISRMSKAERDFIVTAQPQSAQAEAFRILCSNAGFYGEHSLPKTILVTSPGGSEGKSTIAINLAMTLAQASFRVVVIDADLRRPTLNRRFNLDPRRPGLSDALRTGSVDGLLQPTTMENLAVLASGALPADPAQLLRSHEMQQVLDELAQRADVTIIDGTPILPVVDAALIAPRMDSVLLVIRAGRTRWEAAQAAVESLGHAGTPILGVVINDVDPGKSTYYSSYYRRVAGAMVEQLPHPEQAQQHAPAATVLEHLPDGELVDAGSQVQAAAGQQPRAEGQPQVPSTPTAQKAAALPEDTAGVVPSGGSAALKERVGAADHERFYHRELSDAQVEYLFLDTLRRPLPKLGDDMEGALCAWAINADGRRALLHVASYSAESYETWLDFLLGMVDRGLSAPILACAEGTPGLMRAVGEVFPNSLHQSCLSRKIRTVGDEIPGSARAEVKAMMQAAYYAPNAEVAESIAADVLRIYSARYPSAVKLFRDDWETCIAYLHCPFAHHRHIRTTTLLQRSFADERRRILDGSPVYAEKESQELVFALLWQASQRWPGIKMGEAEQEQLGLLRRKLGLLEG